ncbi:MAG TPA: hypothetical protein VGD13_17390 [Xanthobacteraceae bacterium]
MIFDLATFTTIHTILSVVALVAGLVVVAALVQGRPAPRWTMLFLVTAIATSVTGFGFPFSAVLPSHVVGGVALLILAAVLFAAYMANPGRAWNWTYAAGLVVSVYLLVFVAIAQAFLKVPVLKAAAPTQSELPFALAQLAALAVFAALAVMAARSFDATAKA